MPAREHILTQVQKEVCALLIWDGAVGIIRVLATLKLNVQALVLGPVLVRGEGIIERLPSDDV
jgi:hypothetical protein